MLSLSLSWTSSSSLSVFLLFALYPFFCHTLSPNLFSICLSAFLHRVHLCAILSNSASSHFVILCPFYFIFTTRAPFSVLQSNPFTLPSNSLGHPRVLFLFFHLTISCSVLLSILSSLSLPLCSAHLQHIKIPLFFLQRIVQSHRDLLHSSMLSPSCSPYLSPLVSLHFGSTTQHLIQPIFSFVLLTHLYPSLSPSVLYFSIPPCRYNNRY